VPLDAEDIADDEYVTQRIERGRAEIDRPRVSDFDGMVSVSRGRKTPSQMFHVVRKAAKCGPDDGARYARVGDLRSAGFDVTHTPNRRNPDHASVSYPADWDDPVALLFRSCFSERRWNREEGEDE
jgi:hypothetical protein